MSNRSGSPYSVPRDANRVPFLVAASTADGITPVVLEADPATHALVTSGAGGGGGTQYAELATTAPATGTAALGRYKSSAPTLTDGQLYALQLDVGGNLKTVGSVADASADSGNPVKVGGIYESTLPTYTTGQRGNLHVGTRGATHVQLMVPDSSTQVAFAGAADASANPGVSSRMETISRDSVYNGSTWDRTRSASGANNTTGTGLLGAGGLAVAATALPSAATATNWVSEMSDKYGRQVVLAGTVRDLVGTQTTTISASTSETTVVTAGGAGVFNDLVALIVSNTSATAARVDFRDTTAGTVLFSLFVPASDMRGLTINTPIPQTTANTNWTAQSSASVTDLRVYCVFHKNK